METDRAACKEEERKYEMDVEIVVDKVEAEVQTDSPQYFPPEERPIRTNQSKHRTKFVPTLPLFTQLSQ